MSSQQTPVERMLQIVGGFWAARAVCVAAKLGLADQLAAGPKTVEQLASATGTHAQSLYRLLRALASIECFREESPRRFASTPLGDTLRTGVAGTLRFPAIAILGQEHYDAWGDVLHAVRTGQTAFDHHFGMGIWEYYKQHDEHAKNFDQAMTDFTHAIDAAIIEAYDFTGVKHLVDIGGGHGVLLCDIIEKNPTIRGTIFDQPYVAEGAKKSIAARGFADRITTAGGDFFESVPAADVYMMKFIIHDWDDEKSIKILSTVRKSITPGGRLLIIDSVIPQGNDPDFGKFMDLNMLVMTGGRERTEKEFAELLKAAAFRLTYVVPTNSAVSVVEAVPV